MILVKIPFYLCLIAFFLIIAAFIATITLTAAFMRWGIDEYRRHQ